MAGHGLTRWLWLSSKLTLTKDTCRRALACDMYVLAVYVLCPWDRWGFAAGWSKWVTRE